jgi:hypothetical protein
VVLCEACGDVNMWIGVTQLQEGEKIEECVE